MHAKFWPAMLQQPLMFASRLIILITLIVLPVPPCSPTFHQAGFFSKFLGEKTNLPTHCSVSPESLRQTGRQSVGQSSRRSIFPQSSPLGMPHQQLLGEVVGQGRKAQPWKKVWPPSGPVEPIGNQIKRGNVVLFEGGGAYPNKIKESEGSRL